MTFFKIVGLTLVAIALLNLMQVAVELAIRSRVYACSSINKYDPPDLKKICRIKK
jgi:hypothetical protein